MIDILVGEGMGVGDGMAGVLVITREE